MAATGSASDPESSAYLDFELQIGLGQGRDYPVSVLSSPAGKPQDIMHFPFDELQLDSRLKDVQIALLSPAEARRRAPTAEEQGIQHFGRELFDALMVGEVRSAYNISCRQAEAQGKGLRVVLRVQSPALASLPWEFLYDPREGEYLCLMSDRPVVRYIETAQPVQPLTVTSPLRILGMIASPAGLPSLNVEQEKLRLAKATEKLQAQGLVELVWLEGQTWRDLQRVMRGGPWHIFHFVGHGGFDSVRDEGLIVVAGDAGQPYYLTATDLSRLLADHKPLRLVLLNACEGARGGSQDTFSSTASILVRRGVPAVVAMQYPVTDRAAVEFARSFYESLADGLPVDAAVAEARKAVSIAVAGTAEWGTPVLFMRASDGRIFDITRAPQQAIPAPTLPPTAAPASTIVPEVVQISAPAAEPLAPRAAVSVKPVPQPAAAAEAHAPSSQPATPAQRRWLWPAVGGVIGLLAIVVAVVIANGGGRQLTPTSILTGMPAVLATSELPAAAFVDTATPLPTNTTPTPIASSIGALTLTAASTDTSRSISAPTLTLDATPSSTLAPSVTPTALPGFTVANASVNVRSGPGTVYPVIGALKAGQSVAITGRNAAGDWWQFSYNGRSGWVSNSVVRASAEALAVAVMPVPPTPTPGIGSTWTSPIDGMRLVYVPAGQFLMGSADSDSDASSHEKPQHKVTLDAYWIDRTEVTNAMFARFVKASGYQTDAEKAGNGTVFSLTSKSWQETAGANWQHPHGPGSGLGGLDNHPVILVSWSDAAAYCAWAGRRLPTEAEWEKAARGTDGRKFPWGNQDLSGALVNFADRNLDVDWADKSADDGYQLTAPVGSYPKGASPYGALDMAGNVWEWVADWYGENYYAGSPAANPMGPATGQLRVLRGGAWDNSRLYADRWFVRTALRYPSNPVGRFNSVGFRCARSD